MDSDAVKLAVLAQQMADIARRVSTLEGQFWAIILLLVGNLFATIAGLWRSNGKKA